MLGPLKMSRNGNIYILVIVDHKTKFIWLFAIKNQKAREVAKCLMHVVTYFGLSESLQTDQGKNYESDLLAELCELLDIDKIRTTSYHLECDGLSERLNRTVIKMIKTYINEDHDNWDELLDGLAFAYNTSVHATTKYTPFELMFGRMPKIPADLIMERPELEFPITPGEHVNKIKNSLIGAFKAVRENTESRMEIAKIYHDRINIVAKFKPGDRVWAKKFKGEPGDCKKFVNKWKGPFTVDTILNGIDYVLKPDIFRGKRITVHRNNLNAIIET